MSSRKKILVTGGAGFIGSHTVVALIEAGYDPIIVDTFENAYAFIIDGIEKITSIRPKVYQIDCTNFELFNTVFEENTIEGVIHFAAYKAVGGSYETPLEYYSNNINTTISLLRLMKKHKVDNLVFSSSATVYGDPLKIPVDENESIKPALSPYGNTKQICEEIIQDTSRVEYSFHSTLLRYFNPIGAHQSGLIGELPIGRPNNLVPYITQALSGKVVNLSVYGNDYNTPDGTCVRDYIHVLDLADAHLKALSQLMEGREKSIDVINLGSGKGSSVLDLINTYQKATNLKVPYEFAPRREGDVAVLYANPEKAKKVLNWEVKHSLEDALSHSWKWQKYANEKLNDIT